MTPTAEPRPGRPGRAFALGIFAVDLLLVLAFVTVGRAAHAPDADLGAVVGGIHSTGWPFVIGLLVAWVGGQAWRRPLTWPTGVAVWVITYGVGIALRWVTDDGVAPGFLVVAGLVLATTLVGWRLLLAFVAREWAARPRASADDLRQSD